jgi:hypothetical protein
MSTKALGTTAGPSKVEMKGSPIRDEAPSLATAFSCSCLASDWPSLTAASDPIAAIPWRKLASKRVKALAAMSLFLAGKF